ncbi:MAG: putative aspartokinase [Methanomassiliicoccales archaeon PtaU1.Bin124]|nr:MAG: putative aspartokinase [Methanomassiliicoccales archaeon PtaU1.Bin124]
MIKVMKFGGTSVGSGAMMAKTADIIMHERARKAVVVSAMSGVTNMLIAMMKEAEQRQEADLQALRQKHIDAAQATMTPELLDRYVPQLDQRVDGLREALRSYHAAPRGHEKKVWYDIISSWGERLSSLTLAFILRSKGCDAIALTSEEAGIVATGLPGNGTADLYTTSINLKARVLPAIGRGQTPIITGFYGVGPDGRPMTFGRGGSDYSGSVVANGLDADAVEIWTDVDGFMTADPRIVPKAKTLTVMDYNEAAELAYFGAKVLHPRTIEPARKKDLEVWVKNSFNPDGEGTKICRLRQPSGSMLRSVAMKKDLSIVKVYSGEIVYQPGLVNRILENVLADGVTTYAISTSLSTLAVLMPSEQVSESVERLRALKDDVEKVEVKDNVSLICAVGDGMLQTCGVSAQVFATVADAGANVEMISEGASDVALNFVVSNERAVDVVVKLHQRYIGD